MLILSQRNKKLHPGAKMRKCSQVGLKMSQSAPGSCNRASGFPAALRRFLNRIARMTLALFVPCVTGVACLGAPAAAAAPAFGCWFWSAAEFEPEGYRPFLDLVKQHAAYDRLTTSLRVAGHEVTEAATHDQIRRAAEYSERSGMKLVMDLDVRLARADFYRAHPDELQEMLRLREVGLSTTGEVHLTITAEVLGDHYTGNTTPYVPVASRLVRVFSYRKSANDGVPESVEDITARCHLTESASNRVIVAIPGDATTSGRHAAALVAFSHFTPDVFAPHLFEFQRAILQQYADVPLAGACKDEWGFPPCFDGNPAHNDFWFSRAHAAAYKRVSRGRDLVRDCLLMSLGERGQERERLAAINRYQQLATQRNAAVEEDFYRAVKKVFGASGIVATHPTWWPNPDLREIKKNGLDWWAARRDIAQTDEATPFSVRTALAKKWNSPTWVNMFYSSKLEDYESAVWSAALGGGRLNFHPLYPSPHGLRLEITAGLLCGDLMRANVRIRLLDFISRTPLDCPVAVIFGHAAAMNWAGPHFNDVGLALTDALWRAGQPADLIPSSEIASGALRIGKNGWLQYGPQRYSAAVLYHPEFEPAETAALIRRAAKGPTAIWRVGEWTRDFNARSLAPRLPKQLQSSRDVAACAAQVLTQLREHGVVAQTPATATIGWDVKTVAPSRAGQCRLIDGTAIWLAGSERLAGDSIEVNQPVNGQVITAKATGVLAVRLDMAGQLEALAAGGLSHIQGGGLDLVLDPPLDLALRRDASGRWRGLIQDCAGPVPPALLRITSAWELRPTPPPLANTEH